MSARIVIVSHVRTKEPFQVPLVEDNDVVEAFAPDGAGETLDVRRLPWRAWGDEDLFDAEAAHAAAELAP